MKAMREPLAGIGEVGEDLLGSRRDTSLDDDVVISSQLALLLDQAHQPVK